MGGFVAGFRRYTEFTGRSRRRDYWGFVLVNALIFAVGATLALTVGRDADASTYTTLGWAIVIALSFYGLVLLVPGIALQFRRYQDIGWNGAWSLLGWIVPLLTFVVACIPGNQGPNRFGPDPKG
ncbi:DUF805 domain-containing protein [Demequina sp. SYSU T00192]|uniref:DUF805 domain-containing protein n=1 Tax=Demequina litoralis TaxID=3051660 RepID=A0ABT8G7I3_9MICO|nr:DUF805 domain-containing protein [Demequina sp. SYSU T00192]MDN4475110.1 DUF805 domain-containing protein [Demequina sp. SYSU T00192]